MGLRERLLTAGVAIPVALWAIYYDPHSFLVLAMGLQAICIHELIELLRKTSPARALAAAGAQTLSPSLLHGIGLVVCLARAFGGRGYSDLAQSVGMTILVARRLSLMRGHQAALGDVGNSTSVIASGVFLLTFEASGILWVVCGWSSLVALRFRGARGANDIVALLAIIFNSDNGGLLVGSVFKTIQRRRRLQPNRPRPSTPDDPPDSFYAATASATATASCSGALPSTLAIASPNKTWVGVAGAISLGTLTALVVGPVIAALSQFVPSASAVSSEDAFSLGGMTSAWLCVAGVGGCVVGIVGDLWESLLKRAAMVKDSGVLFPGHGGCLDRLDGVLAAAPVYLSVVEIFR